MAKLSTVTRKSLPTTEFALPGQRKDPIPDKSHAKAALTMGMRDESPADKAQIRAAVRKKYPGMMGGDK